ncbi:MAG: class I SAM-dependent methyltransferase [Sedimenticola sp.]
MEIIKFMVVLQKHFPWNNIGYSGQYSAVRKSNDKYWSEIWKSLSINNDSNDSSFVLDLGSGPGLLRSWGLRNNIFCDIVSLDKSIRMLEKVEFYSNGKGSVCADAASLPFCSNSFDGIVISNFLHCVEVTNSFVFRLLYVLKHGCNIAVSIASSEKLRNYWEYEYFPSAMSFDLGRLPSIVDIIMAFERAGAHLQDNKQIILEERVFDSQFIERTKKRHMSALWAISDDEFNRGIRSMQNDLECKSSLKQVISLELLVFKKK